MRTFLLVLLILLILLSGCCCISEENISKIINQFIPQPPPEELCGNGIIDASENCSSCPADVQCAEGEECIDGICEKIELCGNGVIDEGENCENCPRDVECEENEECIGGLCEEIELCGNGVIDPDENCSSCPEDVQCAEGKECVDGICEEIELCGNGEIDAGENCSNCPEDVVCALDEECIDGNCIKKAEPSGPEVLLRVNGVSQYLEVGEGIRVYGKYEYSGQSFDVVLDSIVKTGYYSYEAVFSLYDSDNAVVASTTIAPDTELIFYNKEDAEIRLDAYIYLVNILILL